MSVSKAAIVERKLRDLSEHLQRRGETDLAREVGDILNDLGQQSSYEGSVEVTTTGEAAKVVGVRSINTIKRWAAEGILDGYRRGGRIVVSKESVFRMLQSPTLAQQRKRESEIAAAFEPFDAGEDIPEPTPWSGRKPWADAPDARE